jgi:hypothetical protein
MWSGSACSSSSTGFDLLRGAIAALFFPANRSRTGLYCSRYRRKKCLALAPLATAKGLAYINKNPCCAAQ